MSMSYSRNTQDCIWYTYATIPAGADEKNPDNWLFVVEWFCKIPYREIKDNRQIWLKKLQEEVKCTDIQIQEISGYMDDFIKEVEHGN